MVIVDLARRIALLIFVCLEVIFYQDSRVVILLLSWCCWRDFCALLRKSTRCLLVWSAAFEDYAPVKFLSQQRVDPLLILAASLYSWAVPCQVYRRVICTCRDFIWCRIQWWFTMCARHILGCLVTVGLTEFELNVFSRYHYLLAFGYLCEIFCIFFVHFGAVLWTIGRSVAFDFQTICWRISFLCWLLPTHTGSRSLLFQVH